MNSLWEKIKLWTKLTILGASTLYLVVFFAKNGGQEARFWYWYNREYTISTLALTAIAFVAGIIAMLITRTTFKTLHRWRDMRMRSRLDRLEREKSDQQAKAAMLQTRPAETAPPPPAARP